MAGSPDTELNSMRDADWTSLVYSVETGRCTLMLGPDAVTGTLDGEQLPVHVALAKYVKDRLGPAHAHLDPAKPFSVAQAAVAHEDLFTLQVWVEEFYEHFHAQPEMLRDLAALPFELVVNSSPGYSVYRVFAQEKPKTYGDFYDRTARARPMLPDPSVEAPVIYNLYGSLESPSSLILSDNDRLDFIVSVASDEPPLPPKLKSALKDPDRSFLFLGFDLGQWQFRVLLHILSRDNKRRVKSFAFELDNKALDAETEDFYRSGHRIHFINRDMPTFAKELRSRVRSHGRAPSPRPTEPLNVGRDAAVVFICHANEDKSVAQWVSDGLRANGIDAWLDRDELVAGDQWDSKIRHTIAEEADYVVVLQSGSLKNKDASYVNREIALALDRQMEYRPPRRFVIPTVVDSPRNQLDELRHLQMVDLSSPSGLDELVRTIKRDLSFKARQG